MEKIFTLLYQYKIKKPSTEGIKDIPEELKNKIEAMPDISAPFVSSISFNESDLKKLSEKKEDFILSNTANDLLKFSKYFFKNDTFFMTEVVRVVKEEDKDFSLLFFQLAKTLNPNSILNRDDILPICIVSSYNNRQVISEHLLKTLYLNLSLLC